MTNAIPNSVLKNNEKKTAKELITASARNYLTLKLTLPLGNPDLKKVHTNQFLFTELPENFPLKNWETIANALNSVDTRNAGYVKNRWYIEGVTIDVDVSGKAEMSLDLNAFASDTSKFSEDKNSFTKAFTDAVSKNNKNTASTKKKTTSSTKKKTNATTKKKTVLNKTWIKKYNIPSSVTNVAKKVCKLSNTTYQNVYAMYKWMDAHVQYDSYTGHVYTATQVLKRGKGNCVDNSRVFRLLCLSIGVKCNYIHGISCCSGGYCANHQWNKVYINGKTYQVDCGRGNASWGSHWGKCSGGTSETTSSW